MDKRVFVSVKLPAETVRYLESLRKPEIRWIKWMKAQNFHITLIFLGNLNDAEIEQVKKIVAAEAQRHHPFHLRFDAVKSRSDMLWVVPGKSLELENLREAIKSQLQEVRLTKHERRPYDPHILLAKSKRGRKIDWLPPNFKAFSCIVEEIRVFESRLTPGDATHLLLKSFPLTI